MRTLVVGGAGFIGSHLCERLLKAGHSVACVDNFSLGTKANIIHLTPEQGFHLYEQDVTNRVELQNIFDRERPEYIFHLAANSDIQASALNPDVEYRNTYRTTYEILCCMREYDVKKIFFASTSAVYGDKRGIVLDENTPGLAPISYYGAAKLGSEALISAFSYMNDIQALVFRFPNVIGSRLTHGVIYDFVKKLEKDSSSLQILGNGRQTKPYIHVTDLIDAVIKFMDVQHSGVELYNVGVSGETSVTGIADMICKAMQLSGVKYQYTGGESGWKGDVPRFSYCIEKIHRAGWTAKHTSDEAVQKTIQEVLAERNTLS